MTAARHRHHDRREARPIVIGAVAGLVVVIALGVALYIAGVTEHPEQVDRVLLVLTMPAEDDTLIAGVIADVRIGPEEITAVDPWTRATVPGTGYDRLADAYPFGKGAGVARAYAREQGGEAPEYIVLSPEEWEPVVAAGKGAEVDVPVDTNAYIGGDLVSLEKGKRSLSGPEISALLASASYLSSETTAGVIRSEIGQSVLRSLGEAPEELERALRKDGVESSLKARVLEDLAPRLAEHFAQATVAPAP